jgi:SSS family solute:Na+ symporter
MSAASIAGATDLRALAAQKLHDSLQADLVYVRVHAAEALISEGLGQRAREAFLAEEPVAGIEPIRRIGTWRVLARASVDEVERHAWLNRLKTVALDPAATDRIHAIESLAKLHVSLPEQEQPVYQKMAGQADAAYSVFSWWVLLHSGDTRALDHITAALASPDPTKRLRAAYILRWERPESPDIRTALRRTLATEPEDSIAYPYVLSATTLLENDADRRRELLNRLEHLAFNGSPGARFEACQTLMQIWSPADATRLAALLEFDRTDSLVGGAWAILHLTSPHRSGPR